MNRVQKVLVFFLDNNVPIQNLISHNDYQFFWKEYSKLCKRDIVDFKVEINFILFFRSNLIIYVFFFRYHYALPLLNYAAVLCFFAIA